MNLKEKIKNAGGWRRAIVNIILFNLGSVLLVSWFMYGKPFESMLETLTFTSSCAFYNWLYTLHSTDGWFNSTFNNFAFSLANAFPFIFILVYTGTSASPSAVQITVFILTIISSLIINWEKGFYLGYQNMKYMKVSNFNEKYHSNNNNKSKTNDVDK